MCVVFWALEHPQYALILCSNRDEYLSRPTANARFHSFEDMGDDATGGGRVLSGRDLLAGGTWAGISRSGRVAILTNITEPPKKYSSSRGSLTSSFLLPKTPSNTFREEVDGLATQNEEFAGFNLLLLSPRTEGDSQKRSVSLDAAFVTNSGSGGRVSARVLSDEERRCGGMSNGIDCQGASEWPKVKHGVQALQKVLNAASEDASESDLVERLFGLLTWKSDCPPANRSTLRNTIQVEPFPVPMTPSTDDQPAHDYYGTRSSTVILIRRDGTVLFIERDIWMLTQDGGVTKADAKRERVYNFQIEYDGLVRK